MLPLLLAATIATSPIDHWATALGGRERLASVHATLRDAKVSTGGVTGTAREWETSDGRFRNDANIAGFIEVETFDGTTGWIQDGNAPAHKASGGGLEHDVAASYLAARAQFFQERRAGRVEVRDATTIVLHPTGGHEVEVQLDPSTSLPRAFIEQQADRKLTTTVEAWTTVDGIRFPARLRQSTGDPKFDTVIEYTKTTINPHVDEALFGEPKTQVAPLRFPNGTHAVTVPFALREDHIHFLVSVNGTPAAPFIFDTGADLSCIDRDRATSLHLPMQGSLEIRGSGEASSQMGIIENPTVAFGGLDLPLRMMAAVPLGRLALREGRPINGIIGYDVISRFVVAIDYARLRLRFIDPASYVPPRTAHALPVKFIGNDPMVKATIVLPDGRAIEGRFVIDTGARMALELNRPFIEKNKIELKGIDGPLGAGIGGASTERIARLPRFDVAGIRIANAIVGLNHDVSGSGASPDFDGTIGGELLRRFTVTIDDPHERLLLAPNARLHDPFEYDMSGLLMEFADAKFDRVVVTGVLPHSPAAEAGIKAGDEIRAIDGIAITSRPLDEFRKMLMRNGRHVVTVRGRDVVLVTRRLV